MDVGGEKSVQKRIVAKEIATKMTLSISFNFFLISHCNVHITLLVRIKKLQLRLLVVLILLKIEFGLTRINHTPDDDHCQV